MVQLRRLKGCQQRTRTIFHSDGQELRTRLEGLEKEFHNQLTFLQTKVHLLSNFIENKYGVRFETQLSEPIKVEQIVLCNVACKTSSSGESNLASPSSSNEDSQDQYPGLDMKSFTSQMISPSPTRETADEPGSANLKSESPPSVEFAPASSRPSGPTNPASQSQRPKAQHPFHCTVAGCDKTFKIKSRLLEHRTVHSTKKPYKCGIADCRKAFKRLSACREHRRTHNTNVKPFICDWPNCGKSFRRNSHLTEHKRIHTKEKPFPCDWAGCGRRFSRRSHLRAHMYGHTNETPFVGDVPDIQSNITSDQNLNQKIGHTDTSVKPAKSYQYKCKYPNCDKSFRRWLSLQYHHEIHIGSAKKTNNCAQCDKKFSTDAALECHTQMYHGGG